MKTYNLTHMYLQGDSEVYFKTPLPQDMIEDAIALIHFTAEQIISDSVSVYEELLVKCLKSIFPLRIKDAKKNVDTSKIDQYVLRELRCGKFYKTNWDKWLTTPQYSVVCSVIKDNPDLWED